jgi:pyruvate dehydrogenase E2 component (dihydrolipoamide acetyltransferase)
MANSIELRVPDIGDFDTVEVIEVLVANGDKVSTDQSLITLESDKASMEIPSTHEGTITEFKVQVGDKLSTGDLIAILQTESASGEAQVQETTAPETPAPEATNDEPAVPAESASLVTVVVPDIGEFEEIEVIEILVSAGETIKLDQSLITLESDKASMEIPSTAAGTVDSIPVSVGDKLSKGDTILIVSGTDASTAKQAPPAEQPAPKQSRQPEQQDKAKDNSAAAQAKRPQPAASPTQKIADESYRKAHASPAVRKFARQLGVDLLLVSGSGRKNRILREDVQEFVKSTMSRSGSAYSGAGMGGGAGIPPIPEVDFTQFGEIERVEMSRINVLTAENLHRSWLNLPMVTHHEDADITELEAFRQSIKKEAAEKNIRVTGLVFHIKALAATLKEFPRFNSSLAPDGQSLFYKKYFNIGIAVDTPSGLVVPVLTDVDKKNIYQLSEEMTDLSTRARDKKLKPSEMQGACMTISNLGGIGGKAFTPIINPPEVAILGITRAKMQPVWDGTEFKPRLMCPLDITYDHRVIDGADGARFMAHYCKVVSDIRKMLLY